MPVPHAIGTAPGLVRHHFPSLFDVALHLRDQRLGLRRGGSRAMDSCRNVASRAIRLPSPWPSTPLLNFLSAWFGSCGVRPETPPPQPPFRSLVPTRVRRAHRRSRRVVSPADQSGLDPSSATVPALRLGRRLPGAPLQRTRGAASHRRRGTELCPPGRRSAGASATGLAQVWHRTGWLAKIRCGAREASSTRSRAPQSRPTRRPAGTPETLIGSATRVEALPAAVSAVDEARRPA